VADPSPSRGTRLIPPGCDPANEQAHLHRAFEQIYARPDAWLLAAASAAKDHCEFLAQSMHHLGNLNLDQLIWLIEYLSDAIMAFHQVLQDIDNDTTSWMEQHTQETTQVLDMMLVHLKPGRDLLEPAAHLLNLGKNELPEDHVTILRPTKPSARSSPVSEGSADR
jgi:hypothetical protein